MAQYNLLADAHAALIQMQSFDVATLIRAEALGAELNFVAAAEPAERIVRLYQGISASTLSDFPQNVIEQIKHQVDTDFALFQRILAFTPHQHDPIQARDCLIQEVLNAYSKTFQQLAPYVGYSTSKLIDTHQFGNEVRSALQEINAQANTTMDRLAVNEATANEILAQIRQTAAEHGVSQQAIYFKAEADLNETEAALWQQRTLLAALITICFAVSTLYLSRWLAIQTPFDLTQIITSKLLIFGVLAYWLALSAKNFLAHKHNVTINRHRQNALLTFNALTEAANSQENHDIVLKHAAACIFAPQETGYTRGSHSDSNFIAKSIIEVLPNTAQPEKTN